MSVRGQRRPANGALRRRPRGNRAADQMALNGLLVRSDNSGDAYKAILARLVSTAAPSSSQDSPRDVPGSPPNASIRGTQTLLSRDLPYPLALEKLSNMPLHERRVLLVEAALRLSYQGMVVALAVSAMHPVAAAVLPGPALQEARRRLRVVGGLTGGLTSGGEVRQ